MVFQSNELPNRARESKHKEPEISKEKLGLISKPDQGCEIMTANDSRITTRIKSPILKHTVETCAGNILNFNQVCNIAVFIVVAEKVRWSGAYESSTKLILK